MTFRWVGDNYIDRDLGMMAHWVCRKCGWQGSITEMVYVYGKPRCAAYQECPKCGSQGCFDFRPLRIQ